MKWFSVIIAAVSLFLLVFFAGVRIGNMDQHPNGRFEQCISYGQVAQAEMFYLNGCSRYLK